MRLFGKDGGAVAAYHLLAILTVCVWGTTFVSTKVLLNEGLSPAEIFFFRFLLAYAGFWLLWPHERRFCRSLRDELQMLVAGVSGGSLYFYAENTALRYTGAGSVSIIVCLAPLLTALLAARRDTGRRLPARLWAGSVFAFSGVALMLKPDSKLAAHSHLAGGLLAFSAAFLWAIYQTIVKPLGCRYGTLMLTRKVFGYGLLSSLLLEAHDMQAATHLAAYPEMLARPVICWNLLFLGLAASLLCYVSWNKAIEKLGSVVSANYIYLNPLVTCLFSYIFLQEHLTLSMLAGGCLVFTGVYMAVSRPLHL